MNIAFCLYGQPRCYKEGFNNIKNFMLLNPNYKFDFFFHAWTIEENQTYNVSPHRNIGNDKMYNDNAETDLITLYNPCSYEFEKQIDEFDEKIYIDTLCYKKTPHYNKENVNNIISQLYSKDKVRNILFEYVNKNKKVYDAVILSRFDYKNEITINLNDIDLSYIYTRYSGTYCIDTSFIIMPINIFFMWFTFFKNYKEFINNETICKIIEEKYHITFIYNLENLEFASYIYLFDDLNKVNFTSDILNFI
jgi:hypothetical protein